MRYVLGGFVAGLLATGMAHAGETAHVRYHALARHMDAFEELAPELRDKVKLTVRVVTGKDLVQPVALWMTLDGKRYDLPVDDYGFVEVPRDPTIVAADPVIETNQPKGSFETKLAMLLQVPDHQRFHYADLRTATRQTDALIDKAAGLASFLVPSVKGVQFRCPPGAECTVVVHHTSQDEILHPDPEGRIRLPLSRSLEAENPLIEASIPLTVIEPLLD